MTHELSAPDQWLLLYGDILYRYGLSRVRDPGVAEDLVQETLLAALKARANYAGQSSEQTWLIGILKHKIVDFFRKDSREKTQVFEEYLAVDDDSDYFDTKGHWHIDISSWSRPDKLFEQAQFEEVMQKCIGRLPPKLAQLFILRELDGMKGEDICKLMSISTMNNMWVMLSRVRVQIRHCLEVNWVNH